MGESSGGSGTSITDTERVPVTSRSLNMVASRTVRNTVAVTAPVSASAMTDTLPVELHSDMAIASEPSSLHPVTVNGEFGNGLNAPSNGLTDALSPALTVMAVCSTRANGLVEAIIRMVMPACTVPVSWAIYMGMEAMVPGTASCLAAICNLEPPTIRAVTYSEDGVPAE